jgi:hypothetical protein
MPVVGDVTVVGGAVVVAVVPVEGGGGAGWPGPASPPVVGGAEVVGVVGPVGVVVDVGGAVVAVVVDGDDAGGSGSCAPDGVAAATPMAPAASAATTAPSLDRRALRRMVPPATPFPPGWGDLSSLTPSGADAFPR